MFILGFKKILNLSRDPIIIEKYSRIHISTKIYWTKIATDFWQYLIKKLLKYYTNQFKDLHLLNYKKYYLVFTLQ